MYVSNTRRASYRSACGFTLVELMVTVAIVAILFSIAVPSYSLYMKRSRRGEAEGALMDIAQREQTYLLDQRAYAVGAGAVATLTTLPADVNAYYTVTINPGATAVSFIATATPKAGTAQAGDPTLTIDNTGAKTPTNVW